jgi:hypothetical protein
MLYTISEAAKAMGLEESLILKAIEDGVITATKKASDEWHVDDVELNLLYLYLARNYCKDQWQTDARSSGENQETEIGTIADSDEATVEQKRSDTRTVADLVEASSPMMPGIESTCQYEIRVDEQDRISASDTRCAFQAHRARFIAATVLLALGCIGALSSLYFSGIQVTEQHASPLPVLDSEKAAITAATVEAASQEEVISTVVSRGSKNLAQERSSPATITQHGPASSQTAAKKERPKDKRNLIPVPDTRPTTIPGWTVRSVTNGIATLEGPEGTWKVARGDTVPILGKVDSVVLWGNRWIVATSKGLISTP